MKSTHIALSIWDGQEAPARELSSATGLRLRYLLSSKEQDVDKLSQEHLKQLKAYVPSIL